MINLPVEISITCGIILVILITDLMATYAVEVIKNFIDKESAE